MKPFCPSRYQPSKSGSYRHQGHRCRTGASEGAEKSSNPHRPDEPTPTRKSPQITRNTHPHVKIDSYHEGIHDFHRATESALCRHARSRWDGKLECRLSDRMGECAHEVVANGSFTRADTRWLVRQRPCRAAVQAEPVFLLARGGTLRKSPSL